MNSIFLTSSIYLFFMPKIKNETKKPLKPGAAEKIIIETDFERKYSQYFWLLIPVLTILYYSYRNIAVGFYQDDEVAQYINMLQFWKDPWAILGNGPKPGYKIFTVIPALISYDAVLIFNSLIAASTVYLTYILLKSYKIGFAYIGALLLATQPLFVNLSFRSYSEIFTALLIVTFLIFYNKEKYFLSGLLLGYIFTVRQEIALLIIVIAFLFIRKKEYLPAAALAVFPILYNLLGFIKTGDPLFVLTEMKSVAGLNYKSQGLLHYFKVYIYIVGPVCLTLFMVGFWSFLADLSQYKKYIDKYLLPYIIFVSIFIIQMLTMINDGPNPGNWRYLLHISPICALFANIGVNNIIYGKNKNFYYSILGGFTLIVLLFFSKASDGFVLLDIPDYTKLIFTVLLAAFIFILNSKDKQKYFYRLSAVIIILAAIHLYFVEPKKLSAENISVKETSEYLDNIPDLQNKEVLTNHTFIMFYSQVYKKNIEHFKKLDSKNLLEAPKGTIIVWESHYGYRPEFKNDIQFGELIDESKFKLIKQFATPDKKFAAFIFEKI